MLIGSLTDFKSVFMVTIVVIGVTNPEIPVIKKRVWEVSSFFFSRTYNELENKLMNMGNKLSGENDSDTSPGGSPSASPVRNVVKPSAVPTRSRVN